MKEKTPGLIVCAGIALVAYWLGDILPAGLLGEALIALLLGMALHPLLSKQESFEPGIGWSSRYVLRAGIILAGVSLSFGQVVEAGRYALILLAFTFFTAFSVAYICRRVFNINWKVASLLSVSTAICGGTAVATVGPTIHARDRDIAYAISATFLFDILTVLLFPWIGRAIGLSDTAYGLWIGTAVNDTSSVVAAGYAFSDAAGGLATIVKLTRTLFIVPIVLAFAWIYAKKEPQGLEQGETTKQKINIASIFPWFILGFLAFVGIRTTGILPIQVMSQLSFLSKFFMSMALAGIGLKTSVKEVGEVGFKPMVAGVIIDTSVVLVSLVAQYFILA